MDQKTWNRHRYRARVLNRLITGGEGSTTRIIMGANLNTKRGTDIVTEMEQDGLITRLWDGRMKNVAITQRGRRYLSEFNRFCEVIETLKREET